MKVRNGIVLMEVVKCTKEFDNIAKNTVQAVELFGFIFGFFVKQNTAYEV